VSSRTHALVATLLLASLAIASCSERADPPAAPAADAGGAASSTVPGPRFQRSGVSTDLLCALAASTFAALPDGFASAPDACACGIAVRTCKIVGTNDDRRRSLLLATGEETTGDIAIPGQAMLRFSAALLGPIAGPVDLEVAARDPATGERRAWQRAILPADGWVDAELDLRGFSGPTARLQVAVRSGSAAPQARLALGMPRLVVPVARDGGATNVIVYLIDTLRADHTTPYGYARATTPRLDALARQGVVFDNAFSVASWTRPAVASLLTGLYPAAHGVHPDSGLPNEVATLAERFRAAGWSTAAFVASGHVFGATLNFEQGFDRFLAVRGGKLESARTEEINQHLLPHLSRYGDEPFLIFVHAVDPHWPYDPPESHRGRFTDAAYDGGVTAADTRQDRLQALALDARDVQHVIDLYDEDVRYQDDMLGVLIDHLSRMDLERRTIVVVVADHGEELFDQGSWGHGQRLWEEVVRIPLVIHAPGASALSGRRIAAPVQIVDVMPTLLRWFGLPGREACQGKDLTPLLDGAATLERPVYFEERPPRQGYDLVGLIDGGWKIIRERPRSDVGPPVAQVAPDRLFDLANDPRERTDAAPRAPARLATMQELLARAESVVGPGSHAAAGPVAARLDEPSARQLEALGYVAADGGDGAPRTEPSSR